MSYAGDVEPREAYAALAAGRATRCSSMCAPRAEWTYVGLPDLSGARQAGAGLEWQRFPDGAVNEQFVDQLRDAGLPEGAPVYFLCRSGVRSVAAAEAATAAGLGPVLQRAAGLRGAATTRRATAAWPAGRTRDCRGGRDERARGDAPRHPGRPRRPARSSFDETAEALFLTSGFVYDSAEQAEAAFKDEIDQFIYSRYGNPTVAMFEERLRLLEGAEACFATASGMSAVFVALAALLGTG